MLLAIDIGNTNTVFAVIDGLSPLDEWRCSTNDARTGDEHYVWLSSLMRGRQLEKSIDAVVISSVVPNSLFSLNRLCKRYLRIEPLIVGTPPCRLPVQVRVDEGAHVGADRLVNTVAAFDRYGGNLIIVDFGTATTFDVVDDDGAYVGGAIAPGVDLSVRILHQAAAALPRVEVTLPKQAVGTNTRDCMHAGIYWGYVGLVEGICRKITEERGVPMKVVGTGGLAELFARELGLFDEVDPGLTVHGLALIHAFNRN